MKVRVLRPFWLNGEPRAIGAVVDVPDALGLEVVYGGKAERVKDPPAEPAAEKQPAPQPKKQTLTTKSASALLGKKGD